MRSRLHLIWLLLLLLFLLTILLLCVFLHLFLRLCLCLLLCPLGKRGSPEGQGLSFPIEDEMTR